MRHGPLMSLTTITNGRRVPGALRIVRHNERRQVRVRIIVRSGGRNAISPSTSLPFRPRPLVQPTHRAVHQFRENQILTGGSDFQGYWFSYPIGFGTRPSQPVAVPLTKPLLTFSRVNRQKSRRAPKIDVGQDKSCIMA